MPARMNRKLHRAPASLISLIVAAALAAALPAPAAHAQAAPAVKMQGDVAYVSGGVGEEEVQAIKGLARQYSLELHFVRADGAFLADTGVKIVDAKGKVVLDVTSDGPFLLAKLPPGRYKITATDEGHAQTRNVHISAGGHARALFTWQAPAGN